MPARPDDTPPADGFPGLPGIDAPASTGRFPTPSLPNRLATVMVFNLLIPVAVLALFKAFGDYQSVFEQTYGRLERWSGTLGDVWETGAAEGDARGAANPREAGLRLRHSVHKLVLESRTDGPVIQGVALLEETGRIRTHAGEPPGDALAPAIAAGVDQLSRVSDLRTTWSSRVGADDGEAFVVVRPAVGRTLDNARSYLLTVFDSTGVRRKFHHRLAWLFAMDAGLAGLVGVLAYLLVYRFVLRPVQLLHEGAREIAEGRLEHRLNAGSPDELGLLAGEFNTMAERLQTGYRELEKYNRQLKADREYAGQLQRRLLPATLPPIEGCEFAVEYHPCEDVGGDFYDVFRLDDGRAALYVADVAGHGIGAALITVFIRQTIAHLRAADPDVLRRPSAALAALRRRFVAEDFGNVFVSMIYGVLDPTAGRLVFASAGHPMPLTATEGRGREVDEGGGPVITGLLPEMPFPEQELLLAPGSRLVLYTDGVVDAMSPDGSAFGVDRLRQLLVEPDRRAGEDWTRRIASAIRGHVARRPLIDDVTLLTVTVGGPADPAGAAARKSQVVG